MEPFNIRPLNVDSFIKEKGLLEVTSQLIWEPSTTNLHPDGLYSEGIFGQIGSPERFAKIGYLSLNTKILAPLIFKNVLDLKSMYRDLMEGKIYAKFDTKLKEFLPCEKTTVGADTGYSFFMEHFEELKFAANSSHTRTMKVKVVNMAREQKSAVIERMLILPAGLRDIRQTGDKYEVEEINKIYTSILALASEVNSSLSSPAFARIYDGVKFNIQLKVYELYETHKNFFEGKSGFAQRRYARRGLAYGTRNVISGADMTADHPDDERFLKHYETVAGLFQAVKMYQPLIINQLRTLFYGQVFSQGTLRVAGINPSNYNIEYVEVSDAEITRNLSSSSMEDLINSFQNVHMRNKPVSFKGVDNKLYWLFLVYDQIDPLDKDKIYLLRNVHDFTEFMEQKRHSVDRSRIRPLTYVEMFYLAAFRASRDKFSTLTRYPAIELGSIYPTKTKVVSTLPSRYVKFSSQYKDDYFVPLPFYPVLDAPYADSTVFHPCHAAGLGADYD